MLLCMMSYLKPLFLLASRGLAGAPVHRVVRSTRLLERQSKRRRVPKPKVEFHETNHHRNPGTHKKFDDGFDPNDPLRLFLRGPETTQLLTATQESELIMKIQVCCTPHCLFSRELPFDDIIEIVWFQSCNVNYSFSLGVNEITRSENSTSCSVFT